MEVANAVAPAAAAPPGDDEALARRGEIAELEAGLASRDDGADGDPEHEVVRGRAVPVPALAVLAASAL